MSIISFKFRVKSGDRHLRRIAIACNQIWNFCVATQREAQRRHKGGMNVCWPGAFDFDRLTKGIAAELGLHSDTVTQICRQFVKSRDRHRRCPNFRASFGTKRALGWITFIPRAVQIDGNTVTYRKRKFTFWKSREIDGTFRSGNFVQDARGRWYVAFQCEVPDDLPTRIGSVGIDLGLSTFATLSDGRKIPNLRHYREYESKLAVAQRARNQPRIRAIHAKIANARRHHLHEQSTRIARENNLIVIGNVNAAKLAKTRMAKSVLDAGWSSFRHMLRYKAARRQAAYVEADERYSSQVCSSCGSLPATRPKGIAGLGIRNWVCSDCGASHDRDVNAARNILRAGLEHQPPAGGIVVLSGGEHVKRTPGVSARSAR